MESSSKFIFRPELTLNKTKEPDFNKINEDNGLDQITIYNKTNRVIEKQIKQVKDWTIKNTVYHGQKLPSVWKTKVDFRTSIEDLIKNDGEFEYFVYKSFQNKKKPKSSTVSEIIENIDSHTIVHNENKTKKPQFIQKRKNKNKRQQIKDETMQVKSPIKIMELLRGNSHKKSQIAKNNQSIQNSQTAVTKSSTLPQATKMKIGKLLLKPILVPNPTSRMPSKTSSPTTKRLKINMPTLNLNSANKKSFNLETIKSNQKSKTLIGRVNTPERIKKLLTHKDSTTYGPFLNINYNYGKGVEIKNPKIKQLLKDIDYYGPYYSHCPSCLNKNLEFYTNMDTERAVTILKYLKNEKINKS